MGPLLAAPLRPGRARPRWAPIRTGGRAGVVGGLALVAVLAGCGGDPAGGGPAPGGTGGGSGSPGTARATAPATATTTATPATASPGAPSPTTAPSTGGPAATRTPAPTGPVSKPPPNGTLLTVAGRIEVGPGCLLLRSAGGRAYQLVGPYAAELPPGQPVQVVGTVALDVPVRCPPALPLRVLRVRAGP